MAAKKTKEYYLQKVIELSVAEAQDTVITGPLDLLPALEPWKYCDQEHFVVAYLNGAQHCIEVRVITKGLLNRTIVHPREVFRPALELNAASVILAHNHPSGSLEPSREDQEVTKRLADAGKILGFEVLDHLIVSSRGYYSFRESGFVFP